MIRKLCWTAVLFGLFLALVSGALQRNISSLNQDNCADPCNTGWVNP